MHVLGPVEPNDNLQLDGWKQFYPLEDPFFNWQTGMSAPYWRLCNPEDKNYLDVFDGGMANGKG